MNGGRHLPALLAPAGSPAALDAAIAGGADAVYFGAQTFNARMFAGNFADAELTDAIAKCRAFGVQSNITLNTLAEERDLSEQLRCAERLLLAGADALIIADLGVAAAVHRAFPHAVLHASTQCGGHSVRCASLLASLGFSRMVAARELPWTSLARLCQESPIETEIFVHGALCVARSGSCLFSAMVGGRSGNRGQCAQPCRLPCRVVGCSDAYALSLKDLCLAGHMRALSKSGAAALKIEGRMKSPAYVYGVTRLYRTLLDERRDATPEEVASLAKLFSRSGFTDAYYTGKSYADMGGVRTEADKAASRMAQSQPAAGWNPPRIPLTVQARIVSDEAMTLTLQSDGIQGSSIGQVPQKARTAPLQPAFVQEKLCAFGGTWYRAEKVQIQLTLDLSVPPAALSSLRRGALENLQAKLLAFSRPAQVAPLVPFTFPQAKSTADNAAGTATPLYYGVFYRVSQVPPSACRLLAIRFLPVEAFETDEAAAVGGNGVILPPVLFDAQAEPLLRRLRRAKEMGAVHGLVTSLSALSVCREAGLIPHGASILGVTNSGALAAYGALGLCDCILSPELSEQAFAAVDFSIPKGVTLYGALPLMLLERCIMRSKAAHCTRCDKQPYGILRDRHGAAFPIFRVAPHRNLLCNSVPTYLLDQQQALRRAGASVFSLLFTTENRDVCEQILLALQTQAPPVGNFRRMGIRKSAQPVKNINKVHRVPAINAGKANAEREKNEGK